MSFRKKVKKNQPKVALDSINSLVVGSYKTGKTRLWKEVVELHYDDPEEALLIAFEAGYETWELENIIPVHEEGSDETLWRVWDYFKKEITKGLVQEAKEGRKVKLLGIDTADRAIDAATAWILHDRGQKYGRKFTSLQEFADDKNISENGWVALYDELKRPFDALKNAGYGIMSLAWTKEKQTTTYSGMMYNSIELMMSATAKKVFESQAHFICCLFNEVVVMDKSGNELEENAKDKKKRDVATNFHETRPVMYFRPSEYISIAGGRFTDLPEKVDYSAENYLKVFEEAVKGQLKKTKKSVEELKTEQTEEKDEKAKVFAEEQELKENSPDGIFAEIGELVTKMTADQKKEVANKFDALFGEKNYKQHKGNAEELKKALLACQEVLGIEGE
ncbi:AAA family ATPase [Alkalihalobacillus sp. NPDC078783]